ncbi:MAG: hypothetical protein U0457_10255 [Candidatus Sericytochromatia bacterium]
MIKKIYILVPNGIYKPIYIKEYDIAHVKPDGINSLKDKWGDFRNIYSPQKAGREVKDYTALKNYDPIFSDKATDVLKDFFTCGELLPIKNEFSNDFYLYNIFPKVDYINWEYTNLLANKDSGISININEKIYFEFIPEKIQHHIFKNEKQYQVFVTDIFVQKVLDNKLRGFCFVPIWDIEIGGIEHLLYKDKINKINT